MLCIILVQHLHTPPSTHICLLPLILPLRYLRLPGQGYGQKQGQGKGQRHEHGQEQGHEQFTEHRLVHLDGKPRPPYLVVLTVVEHVLCYHVPGEYFSF